MMIKGKVAKFTDNRKIIEIPQSVRDNFSVGEEVIITKKKSGKK